MSSSNLPVPRGDPDEPFKVETVETVVGSMDDFFEESSGYCITWNARPRHPDWLAAGYCYDVEFWPSIFGQGLPELPLR